MKIIDNIIGKFSSRNGRKIKRSVSNIEFLLNSLKNYSL